MEFRFLIILQLTAQVNVVNLHSSHISKAQCDLIEFSLKISSNSFAYLQQSDAINLLANDIHESVL